MTVPPRAASSIVEPDVVWGSAAVDTTIVEAWSAIARAG
jgi:hypothetical protein